MRLSSAPRIATDRLSLTSLSRSDAEALFAYRSLPEVCRYQGWRPARLEDAVVFIEWLGRLDFDSPDTWSQFGIRLVHSDALIGDVGVHFLQDGEQVEIGFTVAPAMQGHGLATEAVTALLDYLFGPLKKHRACASVDPRNAASLRLLRRLGMRQEAHFRQSVNVDGEWTDDLVFAVLRSEWELRQSAG
jgi:RimJ/RimL family protein N-acetyltransferase